MGYVKINLSLDENAAKVMRQRAVEEGKPVSHYLADLIRADEMRCRDRLAEEGYRLLSGDQLEFAQSGWELAREGWGDGLSER